MLSVLVQSFHSFAVFYGVSDLQRSGWGIAQACLFAIIVDLAILFYTVRKNLRVTWMFAAVMVAINAYYYYTHLGLSFAMLMGTLLSFVLPVSVYFYSEEIHDDAHVVDRSAEITSMEQERHRMVDQIVALKNEILATDKGYHQSMETIEIQKGVLDKMTKEIHDLKQVIEANDFVRFEYKNQDTEKEYIEPIAPEPSGFATLKSGKIPRSDAPSK